MFGAATSRLRNSVRRCAVLSLNDAVARRGRANAVNAGRVALPEL